MRTPAGSGCRPSDERVRVSAGAGGLCDLQLQVRPYGTAGHMVLLAIWYCRPHTPHSLKAESACPICSCRAAGCARHPGAPPAADVHPPASSCFCLRFGFLLWLSFWPALEHPAAQPPSASRLPSKDAQREVVCRRGTAAWMGCWGLNVRRVCGQAWQAGLVA